MVVVPMVTSGSSPLTRGKLASPKRRPSPYRLIPAHAGKTSRGKRMAQGVQAHPRSRGENGGWDAPLGDYRGSSPLTRGKQIEGLARELKGRLIPAHAGKT